MGHPERTFQSRPRLLDGLRIIWAITFKDILEALKNKNAIAILLSSLFMVFFYRALPALESRSAPTNVRIYDEGNSALTALLDNSDVYKVYTYTSKEQMLRLLANGESPELGLVIPIDFDQTLEAGGVPDLQGFVMNWMSEEQVAALQQGFETEISRLLGRAVPVQVEGNVVYMLPESNGAGVQAALAIAYVLIIIGLTLIPHLMLEEKQTNTLSALLVSPAGAGHILAAKTLAGLFYTLMGAGVGLAVNQDLVVHWGLAIVTVLLGGVCVVSFGLCLGVLIENRAQLTLWGWILILPLIFPMIISLMSDLFPAGIIRITRLIPTTAVLDQLRASFAGQYPVGKTLQQLAWVAGWGGVVFLLDVWIVRLRDRETEGTTGFWIAVLARLTSRLSPRPPSRLADTAPTRQQPVQPVAQSVKLRSGAASRIQKPHPNTAWGIIWAIAAKDMREAIKNKISLSILLGVTFLLLSNLALPYLLRMRAHPTAVIYDQGRSTIVSALSARDVGGVRWVDSQQEMEETLAAAPATMLGIVLPEDFDRRTARGEPVELQAYVTHWVESDESAALAAFFEEELSQASWDTIRITVSERKVYPSVREGGGSFVSAFMLITILLTMGVTLIPLLIVEEKETHTLEALQVSPATAGQVIAGKALAGSSYCLLAAALVLAFHAERITHWEIAILTLALGILFAVALGLLVGLVADSPTTAGMWGGLLLIILVSVTLLNVFNQGDWPSWVRSLLAWQPGAVIVRLLNISFAGDYPPGLLWANAGALAAACAILLILAARLTARTDR